MMNNKRENIDKDRTHHHWFRSGSNEHVCHIKEQQQSHTSFPNSLISTRNHLPAYLKLIHTELYLKEIAYNPRITNNNIYFSWVLIAESVAVEVDRTLNESLKQRKKSVWGPLCFNTPYLLSILFGWISSLRQADNNSRGMFLRYFLAICTLFVLWDK